MHDDIFFNELISILERKSDATDMKNEMGTRLIRHCPHAAPKAYFHVIYSPLQSHEVMEFEQRLGRPAPKEIKNFLLQANGMMIFSGTLRIFGYVPLKRKSDTSIYNYPSNIIIPNITARIRGLSEESIVVGFYKHDGSYVSLEDDGSVVRFEAAKSGRALGVWASFNEWLLSEFSRLDASFGSLE